MTGVVPLPRARVARRLAYTFAGVFLVAVGLTLMVESMRAVMDVGGACASGGAFEIRQECPDGTWLMFVGIFAGLIGTGLVVAGGLPGGPRLWTLAWPALFVALGWNFLEYGLDPPPPDEGIVWGWLICAVVFLAMGGIPLLFVLWNAPALLWGRTRTPPVPAPTSPRPDTEQRDADDGDLVDDLERLAGLHRAGQLTDAEYTRAKSARIAQSEVR